MFLASSYLQVKAYFSYLSFIYVLFELVYPLFNRYFQFFDFLQESVEIPFLINCFEKIIHCVKVIQLNFAFPVKINFKSKFVVRFHFYSEFLLKQVPKCLLRFKRQIKKSRIYIFIVSLDPNPIYLLINSQSYLPQIVHSF